MLPECMDCLRRGLIPDSGFTLHQQPAKHYGPIMIWSKILKKMWYKSCSLGIWQTPHLSLFSQVWQYALDRVSTAPHGKYSLKMDCLPYDLHSPCQLVSLWMGLAAVKTILDALPTNRGQCAAAGRNSVSRSAGIESTRATTCPIGLSRYRFMTDVSRWALCIQESELRRTGNTRHTEQRSRFFSFFLGVKWCQFLA